LICIKVATGNEPRVSAGQDFQEAIMPRRKAITTVLRRMAATVRRWRHRMLARPLRDSSDRDLDAALARAGLARADLFTPAGAIASHRVRLAHMLATHRIDPARAVGEHWEVIKLADEICDGCRNPGRCRRWLEEAGPREVRGAFCPNDAIFRSIADEQKAAVPITLPG
jgi:hypothetical protein